MVSETFRKVSTRSSIVIAILVSITVFTAVVALENAGNGVVNLIGYKPVVTITGSMHPAVKINSVSMVRLNNIEDVKVGDIVVFRGENANIIHRVIGINIVDSEKQLTTKGDNNNHIDILPVTRENFLGTVAIVINQTADIANITEDLFKHVERLALLITTVIFFIAVKAILEAAKFVAYCIYLLIYMSIFIDKHEKDLLYCSVVKGRQGKYLLKIAELTKGKGFITNIFKVKLNLLTKEHMEHSKELRKDMDRAIKISKLIYVVINKLSKRKREED